jgi:hypothetical protein
MGGSLLPLAATSDTADILADLFFIRGGLAAASTGGLYFVPTNRQASAAAVPPRRLGA